MLSWAAAWGNWLIPKNHSRYSKRKVKAIEPPSTAFMPSSDKVFRWPGAKEPMPPIWIPIEAKLAKAT